MQVCNKNDVVGVISTVVDRNNPYIDGGISKVDGDTVS
jgi:hypothetical protein